MLLSSWTTKKFYSELIKDPTKEWRKGFFGLGRKRVKSWTITLSWRHREKTVCQRTKKGQENDRQERDSVPPSFLCPFLRPLNLNCIFVLFSRVNWRERRQKEFSFLFTNERTLASFAAWTFLHKQCRSSLPFLLVWMQSFSKGQGGNFLLPQDLLIKTLWMMRKRLKGRKIRQKKETEGRREWRMGSPNSWTGSLSTCKSLFPVQDVKRRNLSRHSQSHSHGERHTQIFMPFHLHFFSDGSGSVEGISSQSPLVNKTVAVSS